MASCYLSDSENSDSEIDTYQQTDTSSDISSTNAWTQPKGNQRKIIAITEPFGVPLQIYND